MQDDVLKTIDDIIMSEEMHQGLTCENIYERVFAQFLESFVLENPDDYFRDQAENVDLVCNVQDELNFMMTTLELFGLEKGYLQGIGHHSDWSPESAANKKGKGKDKKSKKTKSFNSLAKRYGKGVQLEKRPTHFDLKPFLKALKLFLACNPEERSKLRTVAHEKAAAVRSVFKDKHNEVSFKKVMDIHELSKALEDAHVKIDNSIKECLGSLLLCFGDIEVDAGWGDRIPPDTNEQRIAKSFLAQELERRRQQEDERTKKAATGLYKPPTEEEEEKYRQEIAESDKKIADLTKKAAPLPPIKQWLRETSIHDLLIAFDRMAEYDRLLSDLGIINFDNWVNENRALKNLGRPYIKEHVELPEVDPNMQYSKDADIQAICESIND